MWVRIVAIVFSGMFFLSGCAIQEYRASKIRYQHRKWDDTTVRKIAARKVEVGMTSEMVRAALGIPDSISRDGDKEKWGYAIQVGGYEPRKEFVYFVYFKYGVVVKTAGDRSKLAYLSWYD
ncbi:MAG: outer membrane protein assembly factor BamE [Desulfatiglandaceae bacterium]